MVKLLAPCALFRIQVRFKADEPSCTITFHHTGMVYSPVCKRKGNIIEVVT